MHDILKKCLFLLQERYSHDDLKFFQLSNIVYHDDVRLERLMNISGYLRDMGSRTEPDIDLMRKNIGTYMA
jgi:hypothetical protein